MLSNNQGHFEPLPPHSALLEALAALATLATSPQHVERYGFYFYQLFPFILSHGNDVKFFSFL